MHTRTQTNIHKKKHMREKFSLNVSARVEKCRSKKKFLNEFLLLLPICQSKSPKLDYIPKTIALSSIKSLLSDLFSNTSSYCENVNEIYDSSNYCFLA